MGLGNKEHRPLQDVETARRQLSPLPVSRMLRRAGPDAVNASVELPLEDQIRAPGGNRIGRSY